MEQSTKDEFKDFLNTARQSGKAESSALVNEIFKRIDENIEASVKKHVNGKISEIKDKLDDYVKSDLKWKAEYEPYIKGLANVSSAAKIFIWVCSGITALSTAIVAISYMIRLFTMK